MKKAIILILLVKLCSVSVFAHVRDSSTESLAAIHKKMAESSKTVLSMDEFNQSVDDLNACVSSDTESSSDLFSSHCKQQIDTVRKQIEAMYLVRRPHDE